ncbi:MAG: MFS transporter [Armatimonadota bacterium]
MALRTDRNLRFLFAALFFWSFGVGLYEGLVPIYARQLGASPVQLGTLYTLRNLALAGGFVVGWAVADRLNHRTVMVASWTTGAPVPLLLAAATSYAWLLPGLLLYEVTYFGLPAIHAYITRRVRPSDLAWTFTTLGAITSTAFLVAPSVGGLVADLWGIRATLIVAAAFYLLSTILITRVRREDVEPAAAEESRRPSREEIDPLLPVLWASAGMTLSVAIVAPFVTPFLREVRGLSLSYIGFLGSMVAVGGVVLTAIAGRIGQRLGLVPTLGGAMLVFTLGILLVVFSPVALLAVFSPLRARAPTHNLSQALIGARAPAAVLGRAFAIAGALSALVSAIGVFASGFAYRVNPALPLLLSAGIAAAVGTTLLAGSSSHEPRSGG